MVLEKIRKMRADPALIAQLRAHQWSNDNQKRDLVERFAAADLSVEDVAWAAADPTPEIRSAALGHLRKVDPREAFEALVPMLRTRSEAARRGVQRFLREAIGRERLPYLVLELVNAADTSGHLAALELVNELPAEAARDVYARMLQAGAAAVRARALKALAESPDHARALNAPQLAMPLLKDAEEPVRLGALAILERAGNEAIIPDVLEMIGSGSEQQTRAAFAVLKRLLPTAKSERTAEIMVLLSDGHSEVRQAAIELLAGVPPEALARGFVKHFGASYAWVRERAMESLTAVNDFVPALLALVDDPDPGVSRAALETSFSVSDARGIPVWLRALKHPDWWVRHLATERLGVTGAGREDAFAAVVAMLQDAEVWISAAAALGNLGDPRGANQLLERFKAATNPADQAEVLDALAKIAPKDPRIGPMLAKIAQLPALDDQVREKARHLVGRVQGEAALAAIPTVQVTAKRLEDAELEDAGLLELLGDTVARGASDFHIATGFIPHRRTHGVLQPLPVPPMTRERAQQLIKSVLSADEWHQLERDRQLDLCIKVPGLGRFRANFFSQRSGFDAAFRAIPKQIPTLADLGLPASCAELTRYTQGLVLVTGPAGCGKSTTLAAFVNRINETRKVHIITVEDPIEFVHTNKEALVNQRQVPSHTASFSRALKAALREDPDVILIGEMRDLETIALAISASETGHLVFGTLSTTNAPGTIDRIINSFPPAQQGQIRAMISESIKAVISQALLPRSDGSGRVAAFEVLRGTQSVGALIRESKTYQLPSTLQTGQLYGMMTMDQSLMGLVERGLVEADVALDRAGKKEPFEKLLEERKETPA